ncbi:MAG: macro domain-containing protein, partial [Clostridia bacterium]
MPFQIIRNDITRVTADVIVNTANPHPVIGDGTDSAVYHAAGEKELLAARKKIGEIGPGQAAATPAFGLNAKYIIHTVGPVWVDGNHGERETLRSCYEKSLSLAADLDAKSIAFPLIATGVYGFPKDEALDIALSEIGRFLLTHDMMVTLVVFDRKSFELSESLVSQIDEFIDEYGVGLARKAEYRDEEYAFRDRRIQEERRQLRNLSVMECMPEMSVKKEARPSVSDDLFAALDGKTLEEIINETYADPNPFP